MVARSFWQQRIEEHLQRRSILWLAGVRRTGKTTLCKSMPDAEYLDCELPRVRRALDEPFAERKGEIEVHYVPFTQLDAALARLP